MSLKDEHWQKLKPLLLGGDTDPGATGRDNRLFMEAILWVVANRAKWSALPPGFSRWQTSYVRFMRWNQADIWRQIANQLGEDEELQKMMNEVVAFGDAYTQRAAQRLTNRNNKIAYNEMLGRLNQPKRRTFKEENTIENVSSDWVWLLSRK